MDSQEQSPSSASFDSSATRARASNAVPGGNRRGIRVLVVDGGGIKGLMVAIILRHIEMLLGGELREKFDFICGTSTGGLIALGVGVAGLQAVEIVDLYSNHGRDIFSSGPVRAVAAMAARARRHDHQHFEQLVEDKLNGSGRLDAIQNPRPKVCTVATTGSHEEVFVFRNYRSQSSIPGTQRATIVQAARATAAAPTYFQPLVMPVDGTTMTFQDGGMVANNPVLLACIEAKSQFPFFPIEMIVSIGCGSVVDPPVFSNSRLPSRLAQQFAQHATNTEFAHLIFDNLVGLNLLRDDIRYFRLQPGLPQDIGLASVDPASLDILRNTAQRFIEESVDLQRCIDALREPPREHRAPTEHQDRPDQDHLASNWSLRALWPQQEPGGNAQQRSRSHRSRSRR